MVVKLKNLPEKSGVFEGAVDGLVCSKDHTKGGVDAHNGGTSFHELQSILNLV